MNCNYNSFFFCFHPREQLLSRHLGIISLLLSSRCWVWGGWIRWWKCFACLRHQWGYRFGCLRVGQNTWRIRRTVVCFWYLPSLLDKPLARVQRYLSTIRTESIWRISEIRTLFLQYCEPRASKGRAIKISFTKHHLSSRTDIVSLSFLIFLTLLKIFKIL